MNEEEKNLERIRDFLASNAVPNITVYTRKKLGGLSPTKVEDILVDYTNYLKHAKVLSSSNNSN